jgi:hypothetical protein
MGLPECGVLQHDQEAVEDRVEAVDASQGGLDECDRGQTARLDPGAEFVDVRGWRSR